MEQPYAQEYLTGNESIAFPFKEDAEGLLPRDAAAVHGAAAMLPRDFLLDFVATIPAALQGQLLLKSISRTGSTYVFIFGTAGANLISWSVATVPAERSVLGMQSSLDGITARLVTGPGFAAYLAGMADPSLDEFQARLPMETAAVEFVPHKLLELLLNSVELAGDIVLYEGYNIELTSTPEDLETGTPAALVVTAGSGLGAGRHDPCGTLAPLDYVGRINGQTADKSGNLQLDGDECYRLLPDQGGNRVQVTNDCIPCCSCDDYANMVAALKLIYADYVGARNALAAAVTKVNADVTEWNTVIVPALFKVTADIYVVRGNQTGVFTSADPRVASGKSPNFASVVVVIKNPRNTPLTGVSVVVSLPSGLTVLQTVYFDSGGQHLGGTATSFSVGTMPINSYFKPIILVKKPYPANVTGTFTVTVSATGISPVSKSITV